MVGSSHLAIWGTLCMGFWYRGTLIGCGKNRRRWLIFRFAGDETPETSSRLPPLLVAVSAPLALSRTALIVAPARVTDTLDSTRNERFHRRHLRHRYVSPASHVPRVASRRRPPAHVVPSDRILCAFAGFYSFPVGACRAGVARPMEPSPAVPDAAVDSSVIHDAESRTVRHKSQRHTHGAGADS